jgi:hypothetical protein
MFDAVRLAAASDEVSLLVLGRGGVPQGWSLRAAWKRYPASARRSVVRRMRGAAPMFGSMTVHPSRPGGTSVVEALMGVSGLGQQGNPEKMQVIGSGQLHFGLQNGP